jgi:hypothetical protein
MAKSTDKKITKSAKSKVSKKTGKASAVAKPPMKAKPAAARDARKVVHERRYEARKLVTRMTFVGFSFDTSYLQLPGSLFVPQLSGLLVDQSQNGCSLVFMRGNPLTANLLVGSTCIVQMEPDRVLKAIIRWVKDLDAKLINAGFEFTEN